MSKPKLDPGTLRAIAEEIWQDEDAARLQAKNASTLEQRAVYDALANAHMSRRRSLRDRADHIERRGKP